MFRLFPHIHIQVLGIYANTVPDVELDIMDERLSWCLSFFLSLTPVSHKMRKGEYLLQMLTTDHQSIIVRDRPIFRTDLQNWNLMKILQQICSKLFQLEQPWMEMGDTWFYMYTGSFFLSRQKNFVNSWKIAKLQYFLASVKKYGLT